MARRRPGVGGIKKDSRVKVGSELILIASNKLQLHNLFFDRQEKFAAKGTELADLQLSYVSPSAVCVQQRSCLCYYLQLLFIYNIQISSQLDTFKSSLEQFATKHKNDIRKNAEFRNYFQQMCARIGVDPLACKKADWLYPPPLPQIQTCTHYFISLYSQ